MLDVDTQMFIMRKSDEQEKKLNDYEEWYYRTTGNEITEANNSYAKRYNMGVDYVNRMRQFVADNS